MCGIQNYNGMAFKATLTQGLLAQRIKHLPAMQETQVQSLGWEDPLEKGIATYSSLLAWRVPWTEQTGIAKSWT